MEYFRVRNWEKFQHYSRRNPPWIKVHRSLLSSYEWSHLDDAGRSHLIGIWLLAAELNNEIPMDPKWIQGRIGSQKTPDLDRLLALGFIACLQDASNLLATDASNSRGETEQRRGNPKKAYSSKTEDGSRPSDCPYQDIIDLYHETLPTLPRYLKRTETRDSRMRQRWREYPDLKNFRLYFETVADSPFLLGQGNSGGNGRRPFVADLEWLMRPENWAKVQEGKYL